MAADLFDLKRLKITAETRAWLQARALRTGKPQQEIAREALHQLALDYLDEGSLAVALDPRKGHDGATEGHGGDSGGRRR